MPYIPSSMPGLINIRFGQELLQGSRNSYVIKMADDLADGFQVLQLIFTRGVKIIVQYTIRMDHERIDPVSSLCAQLRLLTNIIQPGEQVRELHTLAGGHMLTHPLQQQTQTGILVF